MTMTRLLKGYLSAVSQRINTHEWLSRYIGISMIMEETSLLQTRTKVEIRHLIHLETPRAGNSHYFDAGP